MNANKFVLIVYGPMCAGKSVTVEYLMAKTPGLFRVSMDKLKFLISDYSSEQWPKVPNLLALALAESALGQGLSLVVEGNAGIQKSLWQDYEKLTQKFGVKFKEVNLEAKFETLEQRFKERVEKAQQEGSKISVTTVEGMTNRYQAYQENKKANILTLSSDELDVTERGEKILEYLKS